MVYEWFWTRKIIDNIVTYDYSLVVIKEMFQLKICANDMLTNVIVELIEEGIEGL